MCEGYNALQMHPATNKPPNAMTNLYAEFMEENIGETPAFYNLAAARQLQDWRLPFSDRYHLNCFLPVVATRGRFLGAVLLEGGARINSPLSLVFIQYPDPGPI